MIRNMKKLPLLVFIFLTINSGILFAQTEDWDWQWAKSNITNSGWSPGIRTDFFNNSYSFYYYVDSIIIGDTSFRHLVAYPSGQDLNLAIIKRNSNGKFLKAVDIYTPKNEMV